MNTFTKLATIAGLALMVACAGDQTRPDDADSAESGSTAGTGGVTSGSRSGAVVGAPTGTGAAGQPSARVVYFEFDSSELNQEGQAVADAWAQYLAANPGVKVRLEGHADERGTREYNVGLGERRANAVLQALSARGAAERQASVSSFGEERPVALGHDDAAWSQNRRVEIVQ